MNARIKVKKDTSDVITYEGYDFSNKIETLLWLNFIINASGGEVVVAEIDGETIYGENWNESSW